MAQKKKHKKPSRPVKPSVRKAAQSTPPRAKKAAAPKQKPKSRTEPPHQKTADAHQHTWQQAWRETIDATKRAAGAHTMGGQTGMPPLSQRYAELFTQMSAPWVGIFAGGAADAQSQTDVKDILGGWLESQRGFLELSLQQMTQQPDPTAFWRQTGLGMAEAVPGFWTEAAKQSGFFNGQAGPATAFADMLRQKQSFDPFDMMASMPGVGYSRERHEDFARLYKAWQAHEAAQRHYMAEMLKIALVALIRFEDSLKNPPAGQKPLSSLKDVYGHWVNISEEAYASYALSDDHARIYAQMVDTYSLFKKETNRQADQWAAHWNLPTRAEVDNLHKSMHEMRRENRDLRRIVAELTPASKRRKGGTR